jgi:hypothetical protein
MRTPTVLAAKWGDGLFVITGENRHHELAGQPVNALAADGPDAALAIVSGRSLRRRTADGQWMTIATSELQLACCVPVGDLIYIGTDDARVLRVSPNGNVDNSAASMSSRVETHGLRARPSSTASASDHHSGFAR